MAIIVASKPQLRPAQFFPALRAYSGGFEGLETR
jgi:hypothetical protein